LLCNLFCYQLYADYSISAQKSASINNADKIITLTQNVEIKNDDFIFKSNEAIINYKNFDNISNNIKNNNLINLIKITALGDIQVSFAKSKIYGDKYIYNIPKKAMILQSLTNNPVKYQGETLQLDAKKQIEYQQDENILVARGNPKIITTQNKNNYILNAQLISAKLNDEKNDIIYAQAFDKIKLNSNNYIITGNYAIFDKKNNIITIEDNVKLTDGNTNLTGCQILVNLNTGLADVVPCDSQSGFKTTITTDKYKKND
jgi:lipopolysaccharide export system protein LptA